MTIPIWPTLPGYTYDTKWSPQFYNMATETAVSGADIDLGIAQYPLHNFDLTYSFLRNGFFGENPMTYGGTEFQTMMGFWLMNRGNLGRFAFTNPDDNTVTAQEEFTTDGTSETYKPLVRTFGSTDYNASEPIGIVDLTKPFNLYLDGVLYDPAHYTVDIGTHVNQGITFDSVLTAGQIVTVDMSYNYFCKLPVDISSFTKFVDKIWSSSITIHSCRQGA